MPPMFTRLAVLFFFSGASALVYQVLWLRQLSLIFGVTIYAASTVLATFMTGLAIGSAAAGRLSDRVRCPLLWFGATEALIGLTALVLPRALDLVTAGYVAVAPDLESRTLATAVRFACSAAVLLVPAILMGRRFLSCCNRRGSSHPGGRCGSACCTASTPRAE